MRALFASIVAEESFAARVLRQGKGPTRDHRRHVLAAFVTSLRIDALRVLVLAALRGGVARGRERYRDLAERVLGRGAPGVLIGVMPSLRPGDGAALAGSLAAIGRRFELVATHDEDWFRNPRALAELRDELSRPRPESSVPTEQLVAPLIRFREELERLFG
ncbi:MAG: hypothetical protein FJ096_08675 [Deltaproteobacteria bacterium]|nr:hypothetical protein [Deltaproteobacteria bacterium]